MRRGTNRSRTSVANGERIAEVDESFHHSVHVLRHPSILRRNPKCEPTKTSFMWLAHWRSLPNSNWFIAT
jgi:hypothetical protein